MKYEIFQLKDTYDRITNTFKGPRPFMGLDVYKAENGVTAENFQQLWESKYTGDVDVNPGHEEAALEKLFRIFNIERPADFKGHSLSVSDIVVLGGTAWFCDDLGWSRV